MNLKRWVMAAIGAFAVIVVCDVLIHRVWLGATYQMYASWWRSAEQMQSLAWLMYVSEALLAALLSLIYTKGYEAGKAGVAQGFRFGVLTGLLLAIPSSLMKAFVYPYPPSLILSWMVGTILEVTAAGAMIGALYKPAK